MSTTNMNSADSWQDESLLTKHLAEQLTHGRLAIVLGAGVSEFYGLPSWTELLNRLCSSLGEPSMAPGADPLMTAESLRLKYFARDNTGFANAVKIALYQGLRIDFDVIRKNDLLSAIGALAMMSRRGSASTIVTFNYDDLLETFLEYHGYVTASIDDGKHWSPNHDVVVYHPHGFLPLDENRPASSTEIVLGTSDYLNILNNTSQNLWRPLLQTLFRTHTFLYIGLSGADQHLRSLVHDLRENHVITKDRIRYHGVRFAQSASADTDTLTMYENWGVYTHQLTSFSNLPHFLFSICQAARSMRSRQ